MHMCVYVPIRFNCAYMVACLYNYVYACACIVIVVYSYSSACIHARVQRCLGICNLNYFSKAHVYIYSLCMYVWKLMCMSSFDHIQAASCSLGKGSGLLKKCEKRGPKKRATIRSHFGDRIAFLTLGVSNSPQRWDRIAVLFRGPFFAEVGPSFCSEVVPVLTPNWHVSSKHMVCVY